MTTTRPSTTRRNTEARTMPATRRTLVGLHLFNALSAVGGGIALSAGGLGVPTVLLRHTPFDSFVVPGIFLDAVIGGSATIGATALLANWRRELVTSARRQFASRAVAPIVALPPMTASRKIPGTTNESNGVCRSRTVGTPRPPADRAIPPPTAESALNRWSPTRVRRVAGMVRASVFLRVVLGRVVVMSTPQSEATASSTGRRAAREAGHSAARTPTTA